MIINTISNSDWYALELLNKKIKIVKRRSGLLSQTLDTVASLTYHSSTRFDLKDYIVGFSCVCVFA